jgi:hypothetical protein
MKYICLGYLEDERQATFDECFEHNDHLRANGHLVAELPFQPPETALTLYWKNLIWRAPLCCARAGGARKRIFCSLFPPLKRRAITSRPLSGTARGPSAERKELFVLLRPDSRSGPFPFASSGQGSARVFIKMTIYYGNILIHGPEGPFFHLAQR